MEKPAGSKHWRKKLLIIGLCGRQETACNQQGASEGQPFRRLLRLPTGRYSGNRRQGRAFLCIICGGEYWFEGWRTTQLYLAFKEAGGPSP
ncbi:hypothetical protein CI238_02444 [Colletotrichum incanum]|uniref:Uncharacterized protein n=1 Tax=Colletotrichum incanum TaxID=1573173 RepID=A0A161VL89_COLIC|nr:hypothetical protein CI238_02444 [Colletotrichum incanum]